MQQLVIRGDGMVVATHEMHTDVSDKYPGCEIVTYEGEIEDGPMGYGLDPRTAEEKKQAYKDKRRLEYPSVADQLDMIYHDTLDGTTTWTDAITAIKVKYPKPVEDEQ
jgi:hypothetical protein